MATYPFSRTSAATPQEPCCACEGACQVEVFKSTCQCGGCTEWVDCGHCHATGIEPPSMDEPDAPEVDYE